MRVRLYIRVRLPDGRRHYADPVYLSNGKLKALYALVNGKPEHHPEGVYHLCYCRADGRRVYEAVGNSVEAALSAREERFGIRPIYHRLEHRVEAHIPMPFLAYGLIVTLKNRLQALAPGLTPKAVPEKLAAIQMLGLWLPTSDGRWLVTPRHAQPRAEQAILLENFVMTAGALMILCCRHRRRLCVKTAGSWPGASGCFRRSHPAGAERAH